MLFVFVDGIVSICLDGWILRRKGVFLGYLLIGIIWSILEGESDYGVFVFGGLILSVMRELGVGIFVSIEEDRL